VAVRYPIQQPITVPAASTSQEQLLPEGEPARLQVYSSIGVGPVSVSLTIRGVVIEIASAASGGLLNPPYTLIPGRCAGDIVLLKINNQGAAPTRVWAVLAEQ
jgi:hypothetical protein